MGMTGERVREDLSVRIMTETLTLFLSGWPEMKLYCKTHGVAKTSPESSLTDYSDRLDAAGLWINLPEV
jgi:hypothetical protein